MKAYIFIKEGEKARNGYTNYTTNIYRVKNNIPIFIAKCKYSSGCYSSHVTEVFKTLLHVGEIPKKYENLSETKGIKIIEL